MSIDRVGGWESIRAGSTGLKYCRFFLKKSTINRSIIEEIDWLYHGKDPFLKDTSNSYPTCQS